MVDGRISEHGTYPDLMAANGDFARFVNEFGSKESELEKEEEALEVEAVSKEQTEDEAAKEAVKRRKRSQGAALMQTEERNTGAVSNEVYKAYIKAGKGYVIVPMLILSVALIQVAQVMSSYWYVRYIAAYVLWLTQDIGLSTGRSANGIRPQASTYVPLCILSYPGSSCLSHRWVSTPRLVYRKLSRSS